MAEGGVNKAGYLRESFHYFHLRDTAGQERDFHFHEFDKLVILLSGRTEYLVEDQRYELQPGTVLLVRHHSIHKALIDRSEPYERIIIYRDRAYFERVMPGAGWDIACRSLQGVGVGDRVTLTPCCGQGPKVFALRLRFASARVRAPREGAFFILVHAYARTSRAARLVLQNTPGARTTPLRRGRRARRWTWRRG